MSEVKVKAFYKITRHGAAARLVFPRGCCKIALSKKKAQNRSSEEAEPLPLRADFHCFAPIFSADYNCRSILQQPLPECAAESEKQKEGSNPKEKREKACAQYPGERFCF